MEILALVRHGESTWNARGIWTGWEDPPLSEKGMEEAREAGEKLKNIKFDLAFTSDLLRAQQTLKQMGYVLKEQIPAIVSPALKERDYGVYTGKNKWSILKELGEEGFKKLRRGWDVPIQNGETLKDVYNRTVPYYESEILPKLKDGKNVLVSAHGNSLRALVRYLDGLSDSDVENLEIATGEVIIYKVDTAGSVVSKELRRA
ncbi:MAG: hypothetical protein A3B44_04250 [Candidatus Levybacteria bacterium RIFCSPLOWO2_01_FULL_38_21]|nr:MAG: hypothetical protein A3F30_00575 [Candidatus Levybacteria bacterium RIFCSPHIGHO2_12_FULL_37_12]OGH38074.1 MAG: hypothetical protein A3B44_04250 [Candidatus Levybacteria bacterium RIFCSPLOWO2_01_FULL_38_21]